MLSEFLVSKINKKIVYIKGTHNTVADAISRLESNPKLNSNNEYNHAMQGVSTKDLAHQKWNAFSNTGAVTMKPAAKATLTEFI